MRFQRLKEYLQPAHRRRPIFVTGKFGVGKKDLVARGLEFMRPPNTGVQMFQHLKDFSDITRRFEERKVELPCYVVISNAQYYQNEMLENIIVRLFELKAVENVIIVSTRPDPPKGVAYIIDFSQSESKLYSLKDQLVIPQRSIIPVIAPQIITLNNLLIQRLRKQPRDLFRISPRQFEEVIADLLSGMGMEVELTPATRDGGKDILAYMQTEIGKFLTLVEAKQYDERRPVGVSLVRSLFGTLVDHKATSAMLVTTSRFAKPAQQFQERHKYQLTFKNYDDVVSWLLKHKV